MSDSHEWCRDVPRDEAVRAAEDAAAVPSIQHRDLPEVVAALTERVAALTTKHNALADLARLDAGWLKANEQRLTAERDAAIHERDEARADLATMGGKCDGLKARVAELERDRRPATWQEEEAAVEGAWLLCGLEPDWPSDEPGTIVRHAESMRREVGRLRDRVAELEGAAKLAPDRNAGGGSNHPVAWLHEELGSCFLYPNDELKSKCVPLYAAPQPPRGWLTAEERETVEEAMVDYGSNVGDSDCERIERVLRGLLARSSPPRVKVPTWMHDDVRRCVIAAIREAGGEVGDE